MALPGVYPLGASSGVDQRRLGDVDGNGVIDLVDLSRLRKHVWNVAKLENAAAAYADVNSDGVVNEDDAKALIRLINEQDATSTLPLAVVRSSSPQNGEEAVSNNRRTGIVVRFSLPMQLSAGTLSASDFYAEIEQNGSKRRLVATPQLSSDGTKAALLVSSSDKIPSGGRVDVTLKGESLKDIYGRLLDGNGDGVAGGTYAFHYSSEKLVSVRGTLVTGTVFASEKLNGADQPLKGVVVKVAGSESMSTTTDASGRFSLACPPGRFFAEVDGRKVLNPNYNPSSSESYYPYVIKAWEAVAGTSRLAAGTGTIYLPKISGDSLQPVSAGTSTTIGASASVKSANPNMANVSLTVPAGALRNADGSVASGRVGMAPVDPDRLPEPLGEGLKFPLVITIQTDGAAIFDQPVAVKFPNLPDPVTKEKLKPGEKSALWSFNHDSGEWEMQGPMTVTEDGNYVTTDSGVGVRQPGWHGALPGTQGVGPKLPPPGREPDPSVKDDVDQALNTVAQHSLTVRDTFLKLADMRPLAVDLQQIRALYTEVKPIVDARAASGALPWEWQTAWITDRIGKLKLSYEKLFPAGSGSPRPTGNLADDVAALKPLISRLTQEVQKLESFSQKVNSSSNLNRFNAAAYELVDANARLRLNLEDWPARIAKLQGAGASTLASRPLAFKNATDVLLPGFNAPKPSQAQVLAVLAQFSTDIEPVVQLIDADFSLKLRELEDKLSVYLRSAGTLATAGRPLPTNGYWLIQTTGEQRNKSNSIGTYRMVLPPNREFALTYVDPTTLRIGAYVGFSNGNGTVTDLYGPALASVPDTVILQDVYLAAGSTLQVSGSAAELSEGMTVYGVPTGTGYATVPDLRVSSVSNGTVTLSQPITAGSVSKFNAPGANFKISASRSPYGADSDGDLLVDAIEKVVGTYSVAGTPSVGVPLVDPKDSDGKGLSDYRALLGGEDPLNGLAAATGVVFTDPPSAPGFSSVDVAAGDDLLLSAEASGSSGRLVVYDIQNKILPVKKGVFPLPNAAIRVQYGLGRVGVVVLNGTLGVGLVDVSNPASANFAAGDPALIKTYAVNPGESVRAAVLVGNLVVAGVNRVNSVNGTTSAQIRVFDRETGNTLMSCEAGLYISDLISNGTVIYAVSKSAPRQSSSEQEWSWWQQSSVVYAGELLKVRATKTPRENEDAAGFRPYDVRAWEYWGESSRLALAKGRLIVVRPFGLTSFITADPLRPQREGDVFLPSRNLWSPEGATTEVWGNIMFDGSEKDGKATMFATLGLGRGAGDVFVYQFGTADKFKNGSQNQTWWQSFWNNYPGDASPTAVFAGGRYASWTDDFTNYANSTASNVSGMAFAGGMVYGADQTRGVFALNYQSFDTQQRPPVFDGPVLTNSPSSIQMGTKRFNEGDLISLRANVSDDVALASVKWYVNGQQAAVTSGYPWAFTMNAGTLVAGTSSLSYRIEARVFDTGGNFASSGTLSFGVFADAYPPAVSAVSPMGGSPVASDIEVTFSEPMDQTSAGGGSVRIHYSGEDFDFGSDDLVYSGSLAITGSVGTVYAGSLSFPRDVFNGKGRYKVVLSRQLADVAGNQLQGNTPSGDYEWTFAVSDANEWIGPDRLGGSGDWMDEKNWKNGFVPLPHEKVLFGTLAGGGSRTVLGGQSQFIATDYEGYPLPYLPAGESVFTSVFTKSSARVGWWNYWNNPSNSSAANPLPAIPVRAGMNVRGRYVAPETTVSAVTSVDDAYDVTKQKRTVQIVLDKPIGSAGGRMEWSLTTPVKVAGLDVLGETNFVDFDMTVTGSMDLKHRAAFAGESSLAAGTILSSGLGVLAVSGSIQYTTIAGGTSVTSNSGKGLLRLPSGICLGSDLEIENAGGYGNTELQVYSGSLGANSAGIKLGGRKLTIRAGGDSLVKLGALKGASGVYLDGAGTLSFDWKAGAEAKLRVSSSTITVPDSFQISGPSSGLVEFLAPSFVNAGTVGVLAGGSLSVYNYSVLSGGTVVSTGSLDVGRRHQIALRSGVLPPSGTERSSMALLSPSKDLWSWGNGGAGQLGRDISPAASSVSMGTVVATTGGSWRATSFIGSAMLGVKSDGTLTGWGHNGFERFTYRDFSGGWRGYGTAYRGLGSLGIGSKERVAAKPIQVGDEWDWVDVLAYNDYPENEYTNYRQPSEPRYSSYYLYYDIPRGESYGAYYALKEDGSLWRWGKYGPDYSGYLSSIYPVRVDSSWAWNSVVPGGAQMFGLQADGTLWQWERVSGTPTRVGANSDWKAVVASRFSAFALNSGGELYGWRDNSFGQLGQGGGADGVIHSPAKIEFTPGARCLKVAASDFSAYAIVGTLTASTVSTGSLYAWGNNDEGQLGVGDTKNRSTPTLVAPPNGALAWRDVVAFGDIAIAIDDQGRIWAWGNNDSGKLGVGSVEAREESPKLLSHPAQKTWREVTIGGDFLDGRERTSGKGDPYYALAVHAIDSEGDLWAWGYNGTYGLSGAIPSLGTLLSGEWVTIPSRVEVPIGVKW